MVTQSWSIGDSKFTDSKNRTNFVSDWDGNLVLSYESSSNTITTQKWSDTALSSSNFELTADGDVSMSGEITATGGTIGGFNIASNYPYTFIPCTNSINII